MATGQFSKVIQHLRQAAGVQEMAEMTDGQLLECFLSQRDDATFETIVRRHGPMVMGVCRRVLRNYHDAEDAFQATFLVLARKAASIVPRGMVANWLYGVAFQTAVKARAMTNKRQAREPQGVEMPEPEAVQQSQDLMRDLQPLLDEELSRLPEKYRVPIVLCDLEDKTRKQAAAQLGWPEGTLSGRLARARKMLANRLARRGLVLSGGMIATVLSQNAASAFVPAPLVLSTVQAASQFAAGQAATGVLSAQVVALTEGVLKAMMLTKFKTAGSFLMAVGLIASIVGLVLSAPGDGEQAQKKAAQVQVNNGNGGQNNKDDGQKNQKDDGQQNQNDDGQKNQKDDGQQNQAVLKAIDPARNVLTVLVAHQGKMVNQTITLPKNAPVVVAGKAGHLSDLKPGMLVGLDLSKDKKAVVGVRQVQAKLVNNIGGQNNKDDGQNNQNDDGQKYQKDDGQQNQKSNGQKK